MWYSCCMQLKLPELTDLNSYIRLERTNRIMAAKAKRDETFLVASECRIQKLPKLDKINKITFVWKHRNKRKDFDNVEFSQKFVRDGMVKAGVVPTDGWKHMPPRTLHKHEVDKDNPGVVVIIK